MPSDINVIDHIEPRVKFFAEARRVLKPGGRLLMYVDQNEPDAFSIHDNRGETLVAMRKEMQAAGLAVRASQRSGAKLANGAANHPPPVVAPRGGGQPNILGLLTAMSAGGGAQDGGRRLPRPRGSLPGVARRGGGG